MKTFTNCFVKVRYGIYCIKIYLFIFFRLKTCFYKHVNVIVTSRLVVQFWEVRISRFWKNDTLQTLFGKKVESFEIGTCLILGLFQNSSKIIKWWPKFKKNVMLKKTTTTNKQKQQSNSIAHANLEWYRIIGVRHSPHSQFHITTFDVW